MLRVATAVVLMPVLWVVIKMTPPAAFLGLVLLVVGIGGWECYRMLDTSGALPFKLIGVAGSLAVVWTFGDRPPEFDLALPLAAVTVATLILSMWRRSDPASMLQSSVHTLFPVLFVGLSFGFLVGLRRMPGEDGEDLLLLLFFCVIAADTAAYYIGSAFGRRRMAPKLSPKKSWEGAAAGLLASVIAAVVAGLWFYRRLPMHHAVLLGLILGFAAILGDLAESVVKRATGVKDASKLLPGHGGILDRTDSLLFAAPTLYYYYLGFL